MKKIRIVLAALVVLAVIAAGVAAFLFVRTDPNRIFRFITDQVRSTLALDIRAAGVRLDIFRGIDLREVEVLDVSSGRSNRIATFRNGTILYNPFAVLVGKIDILGVTASGIRMTLDDLTRTVESVSRRVTAAAATNASEGPLSLVIRSISVDDSELLIGKTPFQVTGYILFAEIFDDSVIRADLVVKPGIITLKGNLRRADVTIQDFDLGQATGFGDKLVLHEAEGRVSKDSDTVYALDVQKCDMTFLRWRGKTDGPVAGTYDLKSGILRFSGFDMLTGWSKFHVDDFQTGTIRPVTLMSLSGIDANMGDFFRGFRGKARGELSLSVTGSSNVAISGSVELDEFRYQFLRDMFGKFRIDNNRLQGSASGRSSGGEFTADVRCDNIFGQTVNVGAKVDTINIEKFLDSLKPEQTNGEGSSRPDDEPSGAGALPNPVQIQLSAGRIVYKKLQTGRGDFRILVHPGGVKLQDARLEFLRGRLSAQGDFDGKVFAGEASLSDAKLREFTALFLGSGQKLYGTADVRAKFAINAAEPVRSTGTADLTVKNGEIKDVFLQDRISAVLFDIPLDDIFFDSIRCSGDLGDGNFRLNAFVFDSANIQASAAGNWNLTNQNLSLGADMVFTKEYLSGLPNVAQIFTSGYEDPSGDRIRFRVLVDGKLPKPDVRLETK